MAHYTEERKAKHVELRDKAEKSEAEKDLHEALVKLEEAEADLEEAVKEVEEAEKALEA